MDKLIDTELCLFSLEEPVTIIDIEENYNLCMEVKDKLADLLPDIRELYCYFLQVGYYYVFL